MKAYELKALLATLDDSAEVSIELEGQDTGQDDHYTDRFTVKAHCGIAPRRAYLSALPQDLKVIPNAQERIEELEQQIDDLKDKARRVLAAQVNQVNYADVEEKELDEAGIEELTEATNELEALL